MSQPDPVPTVKSARILVVDDEPALTRYLHDALSMHGLQVVAFNDSRKALEALLENDSRFDLIITDQTMPGLSGLDLAREAMQLRPDLPVILYSGYSTAINKQLLEETGVKRFLMKPLSMNNLAEAVRHALDE